MRLIELIVGREERLPRAVLDEFPELAFARWRRGGALPRIAGWLLGRRSVAAVTLWRTVWLAREVNPDGELLLHELCHVEQFQSGPTFPLRYLWGSLRYGYHRNPFEVDARTNAAARLASRRQTPLKGR
jgi:hypothetical protein